MTRDVTVTDNVTGLMWQREADNQGRTWEAALAYCEDLGLAGHQDWRLPDIKELRSIVDNTRYGPAIDTAAFPGTNSSYLLLVVVYLRRRYGLRVVRGLQQWLRQRLR